MNAEQFHALVRDLSIGKKLPDAVYIHKAAFGEIPKKLASIIIAVGNALKIPEESWDIVKLSRKDFSLSLLSYPTFFIESYPSLTQSVAVDLMKLSHKVTDYSNYDNPPILHRKETMVSNTHESYEEFCLITQC